ncbi:hypothetical protein BH24BAC1_BH24BAC1_20760 [soil metagenome]
MNKSATLHRYLCQIRLVRPPYLYPSQQRLLEVLSEQGFPSLSPRTLERDREAIEREYGLRITFCRRRQGYYLVLPTDEDISDFEEFVQLLERRERLDLLSQSVRHARSVSRYLQLEHHDGFRGTEHLPVLWEALQGQRVLQFGYQSFTQDSGRHRRVEPGLLFEDRNRWYLAGWDLEADQLRTFGLDRISGPQLTAPAISTTRPLDYRSFRQHLLCVTWPPDKPV